MAPATRTCALCKWWLESDVNGECRRFPPPGLERLWPTTYPDDSCGEWVAGKYAEWVGSVGWATKASRPFKALNAAVPRAGLVATARTAISSGARQTSDFGRKAFADTAAWANAALGTDAAIQIDRWMREAFASGKASLYDKKMDAFYNSNNHIFGGDHRLFDGGHDLLGAWRAAGEAASELGDDFTAQVSGYLTGLWKDVVTPKGLPVVTWDKATFDEVARTLSEDFGVSTAWLKDIASFTATETVGAGIAVVSTAMNWREADVERLSQLAGSFGVSTIAAANPFLALVAIACIARSMQVAMASGDSAKIKDAAFDLVKGGAGTGVFLGASAVIGGPAWVGLVAGVAAGVVARKGLQHARNAIENIDWHDVSNFASQYLKRQADDILKRGRSGPGAGMAPA